MFKWIHYASWQVASTSASSTESKNRSTSCSSRPLQLKSLKHYETSFLTEVESNNHRQSTTHGIPFLSRLSATRKTRNTTSKWIRRANLGTDSISWTPRRWNRVRCVSDSIQHSCVPETSCISRSAQRRASALDLPQSSWQQGQTRKV